jgi:hypothetical protein
MSNSTDGDAQVSEDDVKKASTEVWREKYLFVSFKISHSKQAFS